MLCDVESRLFPRVRYHAREIFYPLHLSLSFGSLNTVWLKALIGLIPVGMLLAGSIALFLRDKAVSSFLQLIGAGCLVLVVLTHVFEAFHLFPSMDWGSEYSVGHYLDYWSAVLGLLLFSIGYLLHSLTENRS